MTKRGRVGESHVIASANTALFLRRSCGHAWFVLALIHTRNPRAIAARTQGSTRSVHVSTPPANGWVTQVWRWWKRHYWASAKGRISPPDSRIARNVWSSGYQPSDHTVSREGARWIRTATAHQANAVHSQIWTETDSGPIQAELTPNEPTPLVQKQPQAVASPPASDRTRTRGPRILDQQNL